MQLWTFSSFLHLHFPNVTKNPIDFTNFIYDQQLYEMQSVSKSQKSKLLDKQKTVAPKLVNVVGISGTHRSGGNTTVLVDTALKAAKELGAEIAFIELCELKLVPC